MNFDTNQLDAPVCVSRPHMTALSRPAEPGKPMQLLQELQALRDEREDLRAQLETTPAGLDQEELQHDLARLDLEIALARAAIPMGLCPRDWE